MSEISQAELAERVALIKKFKSLLEQQREKFREYLKVLELQESEINRDDTDSVFAHAELESQIVAGIGSLQKVIIPMQQLYVSSGAASYNPTDAVPVERLQNDLARLQSKVLAQNEKNRGLLKSHMETLRVQVAEFRNPYRNLNSVYARQSSSGSFISING